MHPKFFSRFTVGLSALLFNSIVVICAADDYRESNLMNAKIDQNLPTVAVEAESRYVLEFPILIAITLRNETTDTDFLNLPDLGLFSTIDSLAVNLKMKEGTQQLRLGPTFWSRDENLFRTELMVGEKKRMLIDLSQFGQAMSPGRYELSVSLFSRHDVFRTSAAREVEFIAPSEAERSETSRLRRLGLRGNAIDYGSWQSFLTNNPNTVAVSKAISDKGFNQLALHLCLHRAAYGPENLAQISLDVFRKLSGPVLLPEAAALEYELLAARGNETQLHAARSSMLDRWPELKARLDGIDKGAGILTTLRKGYGAEKGSRLPQGKPP